MDDGRDGGRPGSPGGPVTPSTRLPAELCFCSGVAMAGDLKSQSQLLCLQSA